MTADNPALRLYLLRHAQSGWALPGQNDFDRTLDDTGYAQAEIIAATAADRGLRPELVLSSTATRCRQTAEAFRRTISETLEIRYIDDLYSGSVSVYRDLLLASSDVPSLLLIGHNPMIEEILRQIIGEGSASDAMHGGYPPAALAVIDIDKRDQSETRLEGTLVDWIMPR